MAGCAGSWPARRPSAGGCAAAGACSASAPSARQMRSSRAWISRVGTRGKALRSAPAVAGGSASSRGRGSGSARASGRTWEASASPVGVRRRLCAAQRLFPCHQPKAAALSARLPSTRVWCSQGSNATRCSAWCRRGEARPGAGSELRRLKKPVDVLRPGQEAGTQQQRRSPRARRPRRPARASRPTSRRRPASARCPVPRTLAGRRADRGGVVLDAAARPAAARAALVGADDAVAPRVEHAPQQRRAARARPAVQHQRRDAAGAPNSCTCSTCAAGHAQAKVRSRGGSGCRGGRRHAADGIGSRRADRVHSTGLSRFHENHEARFMVGGWARRPVCATMRTG